MNEPSAAVIRIGISSCLLGANVRYDGGHKRDVFITETLGSFVTFVPVCPEVEIGMGTPRETLRLVGDPGAPRLVATKSGNDWTERMQAWAGQRAIALAGLELDGYIVKKDSPSCGLERVRVHGEHGPAVRRGQGLFATALTKHFPLLPIEEEGRLHDLPLRECFIARVFAGRRLRELLQRPFTTAELVRFHTREKLLLLAHEPAAYKELGLLVAEAKGKRWRAIAEVYAPRFLRALSRPAPRGRVCNVLQHMAGYFKTTLSAEDRRELEGLIADYRRGLVPLIVPLTLLKHHVRRHDVRYLSEQTWLEPHPKELMLRKHA